MKKYIAIATLALLAGAACSKVETVESTVDTPITFSVVNHLAQTKATDGLEYPTDVPFGSFAWWTSAKWASTADADKLNFVFMNNEQIKYSATPKEWAPVNTYYWTKTGYITFASYSPYVSTADKGFSDVPEFDVTNGFKFVDYTIVDDTDIDVMYANLATDCTKDTNADGSDVTNSLGGTPDDGFTGVPTIFNHALCKVGFAFRAVGNKNPNVNNIVIDVTKVTVKNVDKKGTFTQNVTAPTVRWASSHAVGNYTNYVYTGTTINLPLLEDNSTNRDATNNYTAFSSPKILLPQSLVDSSDAIASTTDQVVEVEYTVKIEYTSKTGTYATESVASTVRLKNGSIAAWGDNKNITYNITINPYSDTKITFDPAVLDWEVQASDDIELPKNI